MGRTLLAKTLGISKIGMYVASMLTVPQEVIKSPNKTF